MRRILDTVADFVFYGSWFEQQFQVHSAARFPTFKIALNLLRQRTNNPRILETGCQRQLNDWGAGCSTQLFLEYLKNCPGPGAKMYSVDINPDACVLARSVASGYPTMSCEIACADSVQYLLSFPTSQVGKIDLLYLDSFDYPLEELLALHGGGEDINAALRSLQALGDDAIVAAHANLIVPAQEHCLRELDAAFTSNILHDQSIILIDDNALPGGGKPRLAKKRLLEVGWMCIYDFQQTLWVKR